MGGVVSGAFSLSVFMSYVFPWDTGPIKGQPGNQGSQRYISVPGKVKRGAGMQIPHGNTSTDWRQVTQPPCAPEVFLEGFMLLCRALNPYGARLRRVGLTQVFLRPRDLAIFSHK